MNYIIASGRPWNANMARSLSKRLSSSFELITKKEELTLDYLNDKHPDMIFLPHWSYKVPVEVFETFPCVIFHMTDVPYGRGGSPLQNLIAHGHIETMISALTCVDAMDEGDVYLKRPLTLEGSAENIFSRASDIIEDMIVDIINCKPTPEPQQGIPTTFKRRTPAQSQIPGDGEIKEIYDHIRMLDASGYPTAYIEHGKFRLEFNQASNEGNTVRANVTISRKSEENKQ